MIDDNPVEEDARSSENSASDPEDGAIETKKRKRSKARFGSTDPPTTLQKLVTHVIMCQELSTVECWGMEL